MKKYLLLFACAMSCCAQDTPRNFGGFCEVEAGGHTWTTNCRSEDMGAEGYNNRFRVVLASAPGDISFARSAMFVKCESLADGRMKIIAPLWGTITMLPFSGEIRSYMIRAAGVYEVRPQNLAVLPDVGGAYAVVIDEPQGDFNGHVPSQEWIARHVSDFARLSHAK